MGECVVLDKASLDQSKYYGHCFRIGATMTAVDRGIEDSVNKILGRLDRLAYLEYVCIPRSSLIQYARMLASSLASVAQFAAYCYRFLCQFVWLYCDFFLSCYINRANLCL